MDEDISTEQKTWQVYSFLGKKVFRLGFNESRHGFFFFFFFFFGGGGGGHVLFQFLCNLQQYCDSAYNKLNSHQQKEFINITKMNYIGEKK